MECCNDEKAKAGPTIDEAKTDLVTCPLCVDILQTPVMLQLPCECDNVVCMWCARDYAAQTDHIKCLICKQPAARNTPTPHKRAYKISQMMEQFGVGDYVCRRCAYAAPSLSAFDEHNRAAGAQPCPDAPSACTYAACSVSVPYADLAAHQKTCRHRPRCNVCKQPMSDASASLHEFACSYSIRLFQRRVHSNVRDTMTPESSGTTFTERISYLGATFTQGAKTQADRNTILQSMIATLQNDIVPVPADDVPAPVVSIIAVVAASSASSASSASATSALPTYRRMTRSTMATPAATAVTATATTATTAATAAAATVGRHTTVTLDRLVDGRCVRHVNRRHRSDQFLFELATGKRFEWSMAARQYQISPVQQYPFYIHQRNRSTMSHVRIYKVYRAGAVRAVETLDEFATCMHLRFRTWRKRDTDIDVACAFKFDGDTIGWKRMGEWVTN
jgi:hypothetical protein